MMNVAAVNAHTRLMIVHALNPEKSSMSILSIEPGQMQTKSAVKKTPAM